MLRINDPFHGAVLNHRHGTVRDGALDITVTGTCPDYGTVTVNGIPAKIAGGQFCATIPITEREQDIAAVYEGSFGKLKHKVRVVWDRNSFPRWRFSVDDNSFWLRDVATRQPDSLFDCFYLDVLRTMNREYGAKFTVNIYFECQEEFGQPQWFLTDFPDRYKGEFEANADWLGLAFHAYANRPDRPYQQASPEKLMADLTQVEEQIVRFAGEATLKLPTVIHWGMVLPESLPALKAHGVKALSGYFSHSSQGWDVNYWLDDARSEYLSRHDALMDWDSGIIMTRVDIVCNTEQIPNIVPILEPLAEDPNTAEFMDIFTHEQYFWPFYSNYIPEHAQRLDTAIRWLTERGYKPVWMHEGILGAPE